MTTEATADADLMALQRLPHVRGFALDADRLVTVFLDEDDERTRQQLANWGRRRRRPVDIKVIGALVL